MPPPAPKPKRPPKPKATPKIDPCVQAIGYWVPGYHG